jgi:hypothetical protein
MQKKLTYPALIASTLMVFVLALGGCVLDDNSVTETENQKTGDQPSEQAADDSADQIAPDDSDEDQTNEQDGENVDEFVEYINSDYGFSLQHPADCTITPDNARFPTLPESIVVFDCDGNNFHMIVIPIEIQESLSPLEIATNAYHSYISTDPPQQTESTMINGYEVGRAIYLQEGFDGAMTKYVLTAFKSGISGYIVQTNIWLNSQTLEPEDSSQQAVLDTYEQILKRFEILEGGSSTTLPILKLVN